MMQPSSSAIRALSLEYKNLQREPLEGFHVKLPDENNLFVWDVVIFGPPATIYEGGYFKAQMKFPNDYPYSPPSLKFLTKIWHPNVYDNGIICISILHPPINDPHSGELPSERWNPTQTVRTILLSVISLLNEPNTFSPANVKASVSYRRWIDSKGEEKEYIDIIKKLVAKSKLDAERDGVTIPTCLEDYCIKPQRSSTPESNDLNDFLIDEDTDVSKDNDSSMNDNSDNISTLSK